MVKSRKDILLEEMRAEVQKFCKEFRYRFGLTPTVLLPGLKSGIARFSLMELEAITNSCIQGDFTIRTHRRMRMVIIPRHVFFKIAMDMGYGPLHIAQEYGYNHATVLHAKTSIEKLLEAGDKEVTLMFKEVTRQIELRIEKLRLAEAGDSQGPESESILLALLNEQSGENGSDKRSH